MNYKKLFKKYKYLILAIVVVTVIVTIISYLRINCIEPFVCSVDSKELYDKLMKDFDVIFPDRNRNSGGGQFYDHIVNEIQPNYREFLEYNKMYCAVSGSPIDPGRQDPFRNIVIESVDGSKYYGKQYICCWPCVCDIVKYVKVETHEYRGNRIVVFVIDDPCSNESDIPNEVSAFKCKNGKTTNGVHTESGRLIVGLLHEPETYDVSNSQHTDAEKDVDKLCESRNSMEPDELQGGMGDIFVKLYNTVYNLQCDEMNISSILDNLQYAELLECNFKLLKMDFIETIRSLGIYNDLFNKILVIMEKNLLENIRIQFRQTLE